jgi:nitrite reductase (NADH) small subunit
MRRAARSGRRTSMADILVDEVAQMKHGDRRLLTNGRLEIGVFRIRDDFHAFLNYCPHQGGPICQGKVMPKVNEVLSEEKTSLRLEFSEDRFHLVCPWHGYEFEVESGAHPGASDIRIRKFATKVVDGKLYVVV